MGIHLYCQPRASFLHLYPSPRTIEHQAISAPSCHWRWTFHVPLWHDLQREGMCCKPRRPSVILPAESSEMPRIRNDAMRGRKPIPASCYCFHSSGDETDALYKWWRPK